MLGYLNFIHNYGAYLEGRISKDEFCEWMKSQLKELEKEMENNK